MSQGGHGGTSRVKKGDIEVKEEAAGVTELKRQSHRERAVRH